MEVSHIPIYDHHAHSLYHERFWRQEPLEPYFTEAYDPEMLRRFGRDNLYFRRSLRDLAEFYGCAPRLEAVLEARQQWDYLDLCRTMFTAARISHWLIDDGLWPDRLWSVAECQTWVPPTARRIVRLEAELATMVEHYDSGATLLSAFASALYALAPQVAAFKSIVAYRTGLALTRPSALAVERAFTTLRRTMVAGQPPRIASKPLLDAMLWQALQVAAETGRVVQFHTGYGDPDLDMRLANPLHLRDVFETAALHKVSVVMLHCYPFVREAGYLASVYPGAYLDIGLTIPYTSVHAMRTAVHEALHLAPITKVLFSTDAQRTPELFWIAAKWGRKVLADVCEHTVGAGDLSAAEAEWAAARILSGNAAEIYGRAV
jgi:uncharacterized protein